MNAALWIAQILLALAFGAAGIIKITQPHESWRRAWAGPGTSLPASSGSSAWPRFSEPWD